MSRQFIFELQHQESATFFVKNGELNFAIQNDPYDALSLDNFEQSSKQHKEEEKSTGQKLTYNQKQKQPSINPNLSVFQISPDPHQSQNNYEKIQHKDYDMDDIQDQPACNMEARNEYDLNDQSRFFNTIQQSQNKQSHPQFSEENDFLFHTQQDDKNDSKNVPKGFMKALAKFVLGKDKFKKEFIRNFCQKQNINQDDYLKMMDKIRKALKISIQDIRNFLTTNQFAKANRTLTTYFLRKKFVSHIFNSKMEKKNTHMKYINRWREVLKNPEKFYGLK